MSLEFFIDIDYGPGVESASNRNEYQEQRRPVHEADKLTQKWVPGACPGGKDSRFVRPTTLPRNEYQEHFLGVKTAA